MAFQSDQAFRRVSRLLGTSKMSESSLMSLPSSLEEVSKRAKNESIRPEAFRVPAR